MDVSKYRRPVCRLVKALYGHPDAGTMWEQHCHKAVQKVGFKPVGDEWPSLYFHAQLKLLLVVYVDDLKLAGPSQNLKRGWELLGSELRLEPPTPLGLYLGCNITKGESELHDKTKVRTVTYDMESYLEMTVKKYTDVTGVAPDKLRKVATPSLPEETKHHPSRAAATRGPSHRCTWCGHTMPVDADGRLVLPPPIPEAPKEEEVTDINRGALAPRAASILMKLLYAARICRFDLLRSINNLARRITKWSVKEDAGLLHLVSYVHHTKHHKMIGWVGNSLKDLSIGLFADADYAGCGESLRSTSGAHMHIQGSHTRFPLAGISKRQGCVSHSTPEAEIVAADYAMSRIGLPAITLWKLLSAADPNFVFYDDNQTMIGVVRAGKNPTMRHLGRSHGICIAWMHEAFQEGYVGLAYEVTAKMAADIHTKAFKDGVSWAHACQLINIFPPEQLQSVEIMDMMKPTHAQVADAKGQSQRIHNYRNQTPCFPYTETPILPEELYRVGLSSKEGLQEIDGWDPIVVVKFPRMLRPPPAALLPGRYQRSTWVLHEGKWTRLEDHVDIPEHRQQFDRYVERAVFQYHFQRAHLPSAPAAVSPTVPASHVGVLPVHRCDVSLQRVVAALARAIHGGSVGQIYDIFERNVDMNIPWFWSCLCQSLATRVDVDRKRGKQTLFGDVPYIPAKVQVKTTREPPVIKFCDSKGKVLYTYDSAKLLDDAQGGVLGASLDPEFAAEITIWGIDTAKPLWVVAGVDEENWWNEFVPDEVQIVCSGSRSSGSASGYYQRVIEKCVSKKSDLVYIGSGAVGVPSWLDKHPGTRQEPRCESPEYPYGDLGVAAAKVAQNGLRVVFELPGSQEIQKSEQCKAMMNYSGAKATAFDGCCFGHRIATSSNVAYVKSRWKMLSWGVDTSMLSKTCDGNHVHVDPGTHDEDGRDVRRTSKVARKLLRSLTDHGTREEEMVTTCPSKDENVDRVMIEFCCGQDSNLGKPSKASRGCKVIRVHERIDASSRSCDDMIWGELGPIVRNNPLVKVLVYAALPCTGGSSWQFVNEAGGPNEKVREKKRMFRKLLKSLRRLMLRLADYKPFLAFELPKSCAYWKWPEVQSLVKQYNLVKFRVDGCAVGVVDHAGAPLLKSWCVASNVVCMNVIEKHLCDGKHVHGVARGEALKRAENYTPAFARSIHDAWRNECTDRRRLKTANQGRNKAYNVALPCVVIDRVCCGKSRGPASSTCGQLSGYKEHHRSRSCPEVRVDYVPRSEGRAMAGGGYTSWQTDVFPRRRPATRALIYGATSESSPSWTACSTTWTTSHGGDFVFP